MYVVAEKNNYWECFNKNNFIVKDQSIDVTMLCQVFVTIGGVRLEMDSWLS